MSTEVWRRLTGHALVAWLLYQGAAPMVPNAPTEGAAVVVLREQAGVRRQGAPLPHGA